VKRVRIEKPKTRRKHPWLDVLSLDPRDPDVVRAKHLAVATDAGEAGSRMGERARAA